MVACARLQDLRRARRARDLKQSEVAAAAGLSTATLSMIERGFISERASLATIADIANLVGADFTPILEALAPVIKRDFETLQKELQPLMRASHSTASGWRDFRRSAAV